MRCMNEEQKDIVLWMMIIFGGNLFNQFFNDSSSKELRLSRFHIGNIPYINT